MNRRTRTVLVAGSLAVAGAIATVLALTGALAKSVDPTHYCDTGFSLLVDCTYHQSTTSIRQSRPIFPPASNDASAAPSNAPDTFQPTSSEVTAWAIVHCPRNYIARRLFCAAALEAPPAQAANDDPVTGLPRLKPWLLATAKNSPFITSFHVETPVDLAAALSFYRLALTKRGWSENAGAIVEPDRATIAFATADGPALLRLIRQDDRTVVDLSLRKPAATKEDMSPQPGQVRLLLGNATNEEAIITINERAIELAAGAGAKLTDGPGTGRKSPDSKEINLPPGKYHVTVEVAGSAAQQRRFEVAAGETWGLLAGPDGLPLPLRLY